MAAFIYVKYISWTNTVPFYPTYRIGTYWIFLFIIADAFEDTLFLTIMQGVLSLSCEASLFPQTCALCSFYACTVITVGTSSQNFEQNTVAFVYKQFQRIKRFRVVGFELTCVFFFRVIYPNKRMVWMKLLVM